MADWKMNVFLNCFGSIPTGLGSEARWLWYTCPFHTWLQHRHGKLGFGDDIPTEGRRIIRPNDWEQALNGCDVLVAIERPMPVWLFKEAKQRGIKTVMLCNPEWTPSDAWWLPYTDLLVARTDQCEKHLRKIASRCTIRRLQVPIALPEFPFKLRTVANNFRFLNGWGGVADRKGLPEVVEMNNLGAGIEVYSQHSHNFPTSAELYAGADVIVVPSRFEGVGLTILEAMASGAIVVATDAPPMREFVQAAYWSAAPSFLLPTMMEADADTVRIWSHNWPVSRVHPSSSIGVLDRIRAGSVDIAAASVAGREYIVRHHGLRAAEALWSAITS